ncbi:MAG TPA: hypothetical protein IAB17_00590 [Candidatus Alectryocaccobium stercorigallinarum]|jgi:hypothetical protein|nr:hypothetical protein [Candidatus Alectryocaccobium stercorigallinarum]
MNNTLKLSFQIRNTYCVNAVIYMLKGIPLIKKLLPSSLYRSRGLKRFANIISVIWEIASIFIWKLLYFLIMICGAAALYEAQAQDGLFLHILLILSVIGCMTNTSLFSPSKDKYYAIMLLKMDAKEYTLINYLYSMLKALTGFIIAMLLFGLQRDVPLWLCITVPFGIVGMKMFAVAVSLIRYEKSGYGYNDNQMSKRVWAAIGILLLAAYALPAAGVVLPMDIAAAVFIAAIPLGAAGLVKILKFNDYYALNKELLSRLTVQIDTAALIKQANEKNISADKTITSGRAGFEYLNELFIKRHKRILWDSTKKVSYICVFVIAAILFVTYMKPEIKPAVNEVIMTWLPYFTFIMYMINRGSGFTQALFMNCDHSLLTYPFYKKPESILKLFTIRFREIMKINAVPAVIIGCGLAFILFATGGTDNPLNYIILVVSIICLSLFFSIHYLTIYYLLQPYNAGTEMKSGAYNLVRMATYFACFFIMQLRVPIFIFGLLTIIFCVLYSVAACALVYRLAPKTFRLRM